MNRRALNIIRESLQLAKIASPEQKIKLLKIVKECYRQMKSKTGITESINVSKSTDLDYLDEK